MVQYHETMQDCDDASTDKHERHALSQCGAVSLPCGAVVKGEGLLSGYISVESHRHMKSWLSHGMDLLVLPILLPTIAMTCFQQINACKLRLLRATAGLQDAWQELKLAAVDFWSWHFAHARQQLHSSWEHLQQSAPHIGDQLHQQALCSWQQLHQINLSAVAPLAVLTLAAVAAIWAVIRERHVSLHTSVTLSLAACTFGSTGKSHHSFDLHVLTSRCK